MNLLADVSQINAVLLSMRKQRKLTRKQAERASGVSYMTLFQTEKGLIIPRNATINKLLKTYGFSVQLLIKDTTQPDAIQETDTKPTENKAETSEKHIQETQNDSNNTNKTAA